MTHTESLHQSSKDSVEVQLHKVLLVAKADAVVDPGTVVVTFKDAVTTLSAIMSTLWFPSLLLVVFTDLYLLLHVLTWKRSLHTFNYATWICCYTAYVCDHLDEVQTILYNEEYDALVF